jgi:uncharacterized protein (TIGR01777 family)
MAIFTLTGATGSVGRAIVAELLKQKQTVRILSTRENLNWPETSTYLWNPDKGIIDPAALEGCDHLIHLAGATVSKRWTPAYKQAIMDSRVRSTQLLLDTLSKVKSGPSTVVSASAIGYYGSDFERVMIETDPPADDFLAAVTRTWEAYTQKFQTVAATSIQLRIGIVLDRGASVLGQLEPLAKWGLASPLGNGKQWTSWIHVEDLARMFIHASTGNLASGAYNAVAPAPLTNKDFTKALCNAMHRPMILPAAPAFALKAVLGEMATLALMSQRVSCEKIVDTGFEFNFPTLNLAFAQLYA